MSSADERLPESLESFADPETDAEEIQCRDCGDPVPRRFVVDGRCVGCREAGDGPGRSASIAGRELVTDGGVDTDRIRVEGAQGIVYGPAFDADDYVLLVATDERRLELELDEDAMYTLWTEVKGVPWPEPEHMGEKDRLVRQVLHAANGADEEMLRDALRVLGGERP